ncbi:MAG: TPR end-of-group domain-containing protein [Terriglobales bacterium]
MSPSETAENQHLTLSLSRETPIYKISSEPFLHPAISYTQLGDSQRALQWLEQAYEERRSYLAFLNVDPEFDPLRSDSRFADLVRRVGLPPPAARQIAAERNPPPQ